MINWQTYLRINHRELYQQFIAEEAEANNAQWGERFATHNAVLAKWARKVNELLMEAKTASVNVR